MKVKEIDRTANVAWSPAAHHPIYLACGTAAQQLDATFSTNATLELYALNLTEPGHDMSLKASVSSEYRFHKLVWGPHGMDSSQPSGVIICGADQGNLQMYDASALLKGEEGIIYEKDKHSGPVRALDFNPFQVNLLASGASDSEIFIWDLNNPNAPMTPGARSQPADDVTCVAWNRQVQHILASTFPARCIVWDLRKNEPIIKVSDSTSRMRCKVVAWHPEVPTQMCLASEDDHTPVIQLWDLRYATSPLKTLENHQRGVLSIAWCPQDPDLMLSCGRDSRILCWNPNSNTQGGEVVCELPTNNQWSFDVAWCPRNPAVVASSSFEGHVSIYSLMGGQQQVQPSSKISDSFPGVDLFPGQPIPQQKVAIDLKKPPKWLRKPCGASFGFGGKLVMFENVKAPPGLQLPGQQLVYVSQVVTEPQLISRSSQLEECLNGGQHVEFCTAKVSSSASQLDREVWQFLKANFETNPRAQFLNLLGFKKDEISAKLVKATGHPANAHAGITADDLANHMARAMSREAPDGSGENPLEGSVAFDYIASQHSKQESEQPSSSGSSTPADTTAFHISTQEDTDGLISQALLMGNLDSAVTLCLKDNRMADAIILAMAGSSELLAKTQYHYFKSVTGDLSRLICSVVTEDWTQLVQSCDIACWRESLAVALTYAKNEEFPSLCEMLGERLETEKGGALMKNAMLCYICAGNLDKLVDCWMKVKDNTSTPEALQDLVEQVMILKDAVHALGRTVEIQPGPVVDKLTQYAGLLAGQGRLVSALSYLGKSDEQSIAFLRDRLLQALGHSSAHTTKQADMQPIATHVQPGLTKPQHASTYHPQQAPNYHQYSAVTPDPAAYHMPQRNPLSVNTSIYNPAAVSTQAPTHPLTPTGVMAARCQSHIKDPSVPEAPFGSPRNYSQSMFFPVSPPSAPLSTAHYGSTSANFGAMPTYTTAQANQAGMFAPSTLYNPADHMSSVNTPLPAPVPSVAMPQSQSAATIANSYSAGWNDPPTASIRAQPKIEFVAQEPITHPLFGSVPPEQYQQQQLPPSVPVAPAPVYGQPASLAPQEAPPAPASATMPAQPQQPLEPVQPKRPPIPLEHQVLQDVYEGLRTGCVEVASNPVMRRKLDDVARKLETLYDKLRENALSPSTIVGLHQIVQAVQQGDYHMGLTIHTAMVTGGNFSEISPFMPGLKVLLQVAAQIGVYLQ